MLGLAMLGGSAIQYTFLRGLAKRHAAQWHHAGKPTIWTDQSVLSAWPTVRYLQRQAFRASGDAAGIAFCRRYRMSMVIGYWSTVAAFAALLLSLFTVGWPTAWS